MDNIFTADGRVDTDLDPMRLSEGRRPQYVALAAAQKECERTESEQVAADKAVTEAVRIYDDAQAALPRSTFMDCWRANRS